MLWQVCTKSKDNKMQKIFDKETVTISFLHPSMVDRDALVLQRV